MNNKLYSCHLVENCIILSISGTTNKKMELGTALEVAIKARGVSAAHAKNIVRSIEFAILGVNKTVLVKKVPDRHTVREYVDEICGHLKLEPQMGIALGGILEACLSAAGAAAEEEEEEDDSESEAEDDDEDEDDEDEEDDEEDLTDITDSKPDIFRAGMPSSSSDDESSSSSSSSSSSDDGRTRPRKRKQRRLIGDEDEDDEDGV